MDSKSLLYAYQRPVPRGAQDIGMWFKVFSIMVAAGLLTNSALIIYTIDLEKDFNWTSSDKVWAFFVIQYLTIAAMFVVRTIVPSDTADIEFQLQRQETWRRRILARDASNDDPVQFLDGKELTPMEVERPVRERADTGGPKYADFACCVLSLTTEAPIGLRRLCLKIARSKEFESLILMCIGFNALTLIIVDYKPECCDSRGSPDAESGCARNVFTATMEPYFTAIFGMEFVVKGVAFGLSRKGNGYFADPWNLLDFFVVVTSLIALAPNIPNVSVIRTFRVLRPLKSISQFPGLKRLVGGLLAAAEALTGVVLIFVFFLSFFSVVSLHSFKGVLHSRCRLTPYPVKFGSLADGTTCTDRYDPCWDSFIEQIILDPEPYKCIDDWEDEGSKKEDSIWADTYDCFWPLNEDETRVCSTTSWGMHTCGATEIFPNGTWCGSDWDTWGNPRFPNKEEPYGVSRDVRPPTTETRCWWPHCLIKR